jgi:hypothetical protein
MARGNDIIFKTGKGEEVTIKNGFFGGKKKVVKDRFGNKYESKKGWFGTRETDASVLGNSFQRKKGILGGSDISGSTIFGDTIRTKKGIFGRRTTEVDVSGITGLVEGFIDSKRSGGSNSGLSGFGTSKPGNALNGFTGQKAANNGAPLTPGPDFDLGSFDLNKGLPQDFGQTPGQQAPGQQTPGQSAVPATDQAYGSPTRLSPANLPAALPDDSALPPNGSLPEVPPRIQ